MSAPHPAPGIKWRASWTTSDGRSWVTRKPMGQSQLARKLRSIMRKKRTAPTAISITLTPHRTTSKEGT